MNQELLPVMPATRDHFGALLGKLCHTVLDPQGPQFHCEGGARSSGREPRQGIDTASAPTYSRPA